MKFRKPVLFNALFEIEKGKNNWYNYCKMYLF